MASQCPINTFDRGNAAARTSINNCECNPGFFPADDKSTLRIALSQNSVCVVTINSLSHMEASVCVDTQQYDMESIHADMLY